MFFKDIIGHKNISDNLIGSIKLNKISHAYIFEGADGIGKSMVARAFGEALLCENFDSDSCGECKSCRLSFNGSHPDLLEYDLTIGEDGKQRASISVESIRQFKKEIYLKPFFAKRKIFILKNAEKMTREAQNAMLKIFEEPPFYVTIILIVNGLSKILTTVQSRAVIIKFAGLTLKELVNYLEKYYNEVKDKEIYASLSDGSISKMLSLLNDDESLKLREEVISAVKNLIISPLSTSINDPLNVFITNKDKKNEIIEIASIFIYDLARLKTGNSDLIVNIDKIDDLKKVSADITMKNILNIESQLINLTEQLSKNANFKLAVVSVLIKIWEEVHG